MRVIKSIAEMKEYIGQARAEKAIIGLVPTMGYLHRGHLTLMKKAVAECDKVVASIFVNPIQFGPNEDLASYPRDLEADVKAAGEVGVDAIFAPEAGEMYPEGFDTKINVGPSVTDKLCGCQRPGHFTGVATVVMKLFHIINPQRAYFGQKDAQQVQVIRRMVSDLNFEVKIVPVPIVREEDGLALSSRNIYLTPEERKIALSINLILQQTSKEVKNGQIKTAEIINFVKQKMQAAGINSIDYVALYTYPELKETAEVNQPCLLAVAVRLGKARLIDNIILEA